MESGRRSMPRAWWSATCRHWSAATGAPPNAGRIPRRARKVVAIAGIDTRRLTRLLREKGAQAGCIMTGENIDETAAVRAARSFPGLKGMDLAKVVSTTRTLPVERRQHLARSAVAAARPQRACTWSPTTSASSAISCACWPTAAAGSPWCRHKPRPTEVLALNPDGVFLSNGPGDPEPCDYAIKAIARVAGNGHADVRHLPGAPAAGAGQRRADRQDEVRPPRRESPGAGDWRRAGC